MKKNKKRLIVMVLVIVVIMSFTITAFAGTYSINWTFSNAEKKHGVNEYTMTANSVIEHSTFVRSPNGYFYIGVYNHDEGKYYHRVYSYPGMSRIFAGSFTAGVAGVNSFAIMNQTGAATISGQYTF